MNSRISVASQIGKMSSILLQMLLVPFFVMKLSQCGIPKIFPVSQNNLTVGDTHINFTTTSVASDFRNMSITNPPGYPQSHPIYCFAEENTPGLRCLFSNGTLHSRAKTIDNTARVLTNLVLKDPLSLLISDNSNSSGPTMLRYGFKLIVGTNILFLASNFTLPNKAFATALDASTGWLYIYTFDESAGYSLFSLDDDMSTVHTNVSSANSTMAYGPQLFAPVILTDYEPCIIIGGGHISLYMLDRTNLSMIVNLADSTLGYPTYNGGRTGLNNLNTDQYYMLLFADSAPGILSCFSISTTIQNNNSTYALLFPSVSVQGFQVKRTFDKFVNFGPYQYFAFVYGTGSIGLVNKVTFLLEMNYPVAAPYDNTFLGADFQLNKGYFGFVGQPSNASNTANFQSYYLLFDTCLMYSGTTCAICGPGLFRNATSAPNTCLSLYTMPVGYGPSYPLGLVIPCKYSGCLNCTSSFDYCLGCDQQNGYILVNGQCFTNFTVRKAVFDHFQRAVTIEFTTPIDQSLTSDLFNVSLTNQLNSSTNPCLHPKCSITMTSTGLTVNFQITEAIILDSMIVKNSTALIGIKSADGSKYYSNFPITIDNIILLSDSGSVDGFIRVLAYIIASLRFFATILAIGIDPGAAVTLDKVLSDMLYLRFIGGDPLSFPELIYRDVFAIGLLPGKIGNPFASYARDDTCSTIGVFAATNVQCNILSNYGSDLVVIAVTLTINIVISALVYFLARMWKIPDEEKPKSSVEKEQNKERELIEKDALNSDSNFKAKEEQEPEDEEKAAKTKMKSSILKIIKNYGIRYFLVKTNGQALNILIFAFVNFGTYRSTGPMIFGSLIGVFWVIYFCSFFIFSFLAVLQVRDQVTFHCKRENSNIVDKPEDINLDKQLGHIRMGWLRVFQFHFENSQLPQYGYDLLLPLFHIIRSFLLSIILWTLANSPSTQMICCAIVDLISLVYTLKCNIKSSKFTRFVMAGNYATYLAYIFFKFATVAGYSEWFNQVVLGSITLIILSTNILLNLCFVISSMIRIGKIYFGKRIANTLKRFKTSLTTKNSLSVDVEPISAKKQSVVHPRPRNDQPFQDPNFRKSKEEFKASNKVIQPPNFDDSLNESKVPMTTISPGKQATVLARTQPKPVSRPSVIKQPNQLPKENPIKSSVVHDWD